MASSATLAKSLDKLDSKLKNPVTIYNEALAKLGVGDARTKVQALKTQLYNTEGMMSKVSDDVTSRTANSLVTDAQRRRLVGAEQEPLARSIGDIGRALQPEQELLASLLQQGQLQSDLTYRGMRDKRGDLFSRYKVALELERIREEKKRYAQQRADALRREREAKARAASGGGGGGRGRSSGGGGGTDWVAMVKQARKEAGGDKGWGATYDYMRKHFGYDFAPRGSKADQAFHKVFGK